MEKLILFTKLNTNKR